MKTLTYRLLEPETAYVDNNLIIPKSKIREEAVKDALTFVIGEGPIYSEDGHYLGKGQKTLELWDETTHHLIVPREFIEEDRYKLYNFPFQDLRPKVFPRVDIEDHITLRSTTQEEALQALLGSSSGTLNLACISGDAVLNLNRGGKGLRTTIRKAFERTENQDDRYAWDPEIPTYIRSMAGEEIRLNKVIRFLSKGRKTTLLVELEDGHKLRATEDHEFMTPEGPVPVSGIRPGDLVWVDSKEPKGKGRRRAYQRVGGFRYHPFSRYQSRSWIIEKHRAVAEAELNFVALEEFNKRCREGDTEGLVFIDPKKFHVHHINENIYDNRVENLEILPVSIHCNKHSLGYRAFGNIRKAVMVKSIGHPKEEDVFDVICESPNRNFIANGIVVHNCGVGKTVVALKMVATLKTPTLVVVNTTALLEQWRGEIEKHLDVASIGIIQGKQIDWQHPITLAMVHTLASRRDSWGEEFKRWFGVAVFDEGHHMSAPVFIQSADLLYGRRYSLTATARRTDGLEAIYQYHLGRVIFSELSQNLIPETIFHVMKWAIPDSKQITDKSGEFSTPKLRTFLGRDQKRTEKIVSILDKDLEDGRTILVLSHGKQHVKYLAELYGGGEVTGDTDQSTRMETLREANPVFGTFQLAREGLDKPSLDTLYILTPFGNSNDLQQSWGRIQRVYEGKRDPLVRVFEDEITNQQTGKLVGVCIGMCRQLRKYLRVMRYPFNRMEI